MRTPYGTLSVRCGCITFSQLDVAQHNVMVQAEVSSGTFVWQPADGIDFGDATQKFQLHWTNVMIVAEPIVRVLPQ